MDSSGEFSSVTCAITLEWLNGQGATTRKVVYKNATIRLIRNEIREIYIEVSNEKSSPIKLRMRGIMVHKKFMNEGKASIKFVDEKCTVFLSNAPPSPLMMFLRTLVVKMSGEKVEDKETVAKNLRAHLLSSKPNSFEDISPVTNADLARTMARASQASVTTPSPQGKKRKLDEDSGGKGQSAPKKLARGHEEEKLNDEQNSILQACVRGKNIFFTGSAGTGKSFLLRKIISTLPPDGTTATASTGVAACLIGGVTLHSFAGIGDGEAGLTRCYEMASRVASNWRRCKRLVIDEISMIDGNYFEKIEAVARYIRKSDKPFGGIQLILCGDFLQLPPVSKNENKSNNRGTIFCFQTPVWEKCIELSYELKEVHRQKDSNFVKILNFIRIGHVTQSITDTLLATGRQNIESNGILATQLCSHTKDANSLNESKLEALTGEMKTFEAQDSDNSMKKLLDLQVPAPGTLVLKIGAQVMLLKNINLSAGLVNGARGVVVKYVDGFPIVKFKNNKLFAAKPEKWAIKTPGGVIVTRKQVPLKLAWAFSIHKSQGLTLDCVEMSLSKVFEAGQAYVALSRAQSLDSLRVLDFDAKQVWANTSVLQFYKQFRRQLHGVEYIALGANRGKAANGDNKKKTLSKIDQFKASLIKQPLVSIS